MSEHDIDLDIEVIQIDAPCRQITAVLAAPLYANLLRFIERERWKPSEALLEGYYALTKSFCYELNRKEGGGWLDLRPAFRVSEANSILVFNRRTEERPPTSFDPEDMAALGKRLARVVQEEIEEVTRVLSPISKYVLTLPPFAPPPLEGDPMYRLWFGRKMIFERDRSGS